MNRQLYPMHQMWKYPLEIIGIQHFEVPLGLVALSVAFVGDEIFLWGLVDPDEEGKRTLTIRIVGTGHSINTERSLFLGSIVMPNGLVWHIWEVLTKETANEEENGS